MLFALLLYRATVCIAIVYTLSTQYLEYTHEIHAQLRCDIHILASVLLARYYVYTIYTRTHMHNSVATVAACMRVYVHYYVVHDATTTY